jgi:hypothetical protein
MAWLIIRVFNQPRFCESSGSPGHFVLKSVLQFTAILCLESDSVEEIKLSNIRGMSDTNLMLSSTEHSPTAVFPGSGHSCSNDMLKQIDWFSSAYRTPS